jgi:hypothetical protein
MFYWSIERAINIMHNAQEAAPRADAPSVVYDYLGGGKAGSSEENKKSNYSVKLVEATVNGKKYTDASSCPIKVEVVSLTTAPTADNHDKRTNTTKEETLTKDLFAIKIYCPAVVDGKSNSDATFSIKLEIPHVGYGEFSGTATKHPEATCDEDSPCVFELGPTQKITKDQVQTAKESGEKTTTITVSDNGEEVARFEVPTGKLREGTATVEHVDAPKLAAVLKKDGNEVGFVRAAYPATGEATLLSFLPSFLGDKFENTREGQTGPCIIADGEAVERLENRSAVRSAAAPDPAREGSWKRVGDWINVSLKSKSYDPVADVLMFALKPLSEEQKEQIAPLMVAEGDPQDEDEKAATAEDKDKNEEDADIADDGDEDEGEGDEGKAIKKSKDANVAGGSANGLLASKGAINVVPNGVGAIENNSIARGGSANRSVFSVIALMCLVGAVVTLKKKKS